MDDIQIFLKKIGLYRLFLIDSTWYVMVFASTASIITTYYFFINGYILSYGDAESHLNIAKRVINGLTPGFAQLGGIWLPLPHVLMIPFVYFNVLWRTGIAGSIVSGAMYVIACIYIYKWTFELTKSSAAASLSSFIFGTNPNILYLQATAMTEPLFITCMILSIYYFVVYIKYQKLLHILLAAFFCFCASLSRYDGWFLVLVELSLLVIFFQLNSLFNTKKKKYYTNKMWGIVIIFATLAFLGICSWMIWDFLILKDPFYFTNSQFSAKSQQKDWLAKNLLPAHHNIILSVLYFSHASYQNIGLIISICALAGLILFILHKNIILHTVIAVLLLSPFFFNVLTLYMGQSVIFIPSLTPITFPWRLFNVRYGILMLFPASFFVGYLLYRIISVFTPSSQKQNIILNSLQWFNCVTVIVALISLILYQIFIFYSGLEVPISLEDAVVGLSAHRDPDAQAWLRMHYDNGLLLIDDYHRTMSIIKSNVPLENVIYIGNKPYWEESFKTPEKYARWIVIQRNDDIWNKIYQSPTMNAHLYSYFEKTYTSQEILIFKRKSNNQRVAVYR